MRLIINTGKGGVGKTSISAATARLSAKKGYRTMVMSTDSAHSLSDSLNIKLGHDIEHVSDNLDALEIDIIHEMRTRWAEIENYARLFLESQGMTDITAEEMAILPGMEMIIALFYVLDFDEKDKYDVVVMDTAPTGETLRLLSFPDISGWYLDKLFNLAKKIVSFVGPAVGKMVQVPMPSKEVFENIKDIKDRMGKVKVILEDPKKTTVRLVVNPEKMVISETMKAYSYLCLYNKNVECLMCNRVFRDDMEGEYFEKKLAEQRTNMELIHNAFDPMKIFISYQMPNEMIGSDRLDMLAEMIYGDTDPTKIYSEESPMSFKKKNGMNVIELKMPFVDKSDVELVKLNDDSIMIHIGSQKRIINLPMTLAKEEIAGAELKDGKLTIKFRRGENEQ